MSKIKEHLKDAYDNVIFYADKTWISEPNSYHKANQELYARETKLQDILMEESNRPRTVQDCIPNSKLAKYSNYEYNESRERSYASSVANISFYYPCIFKRDSIKEPWMLPEIEQLFIWLTYSCDFNLLNPIALEELDHLDEQESGQVGLKQSCCTGDFHQVNPFFYETLERTPGKPRYTTASFLSEDETVEFNSPLLQVNSFEDMILRMKIKSEKIQNLWNEGNIPLKKRPNQENTSTSAEKKFNIFKSPLGSFFVFENARNIRNIPNLERIEVIADDAVSENDHQVTDFPHLQNLSNSFSSLQAWILSASIKNATSENNQSDKSEVDKSDSQPTRRLYSAVLQGLSSTKISPIKSEQASSTGTYTNTITQEVFIAPRQIASSKIGCNCTLNEIQSSKTSTFVQKNAAFNIPVNMWQNQTWESQNNIQTKKSIQQQQENVPKSPTTINQQQQNNFIATKSRPSVSPSESWSKQVVVSNTTTANASSVYSSSNYCNTLQTSNVTFSNNFNSSYGNTSFTNNINANNYAFNLCCSNYSSGSYTFSNNVYSNSQISSSIRNLPQLTRQTYSTPPVHLNPTPPIWLIHQHRATAIYPISHYPSPHYLFIPPPLPPSRTSQRWPTSYMRPPPSPTQSYHVPIPPTPPTPTSPPPQQHWSTNQSLYRSGSNHQVSTSSSQQSSDNLSKPKKPKKLIQSTQYKAKSKTTLDCCGNESDFNDMLFDAYVKKTSIYKRPTCSSDIGISLPTAEKTILLKASTSNLECNCLKRQISLTQICGTKKQASEPSLIENERLQLTTSMSEDLERQALEQYQPSEDNFYSELERQAAEQYDDFSENWISPPNNKIFYYFGGPVIQNIRFITNNCLYILLTMYIDIHVCNYCLFLLS